MNQFPCSGIIVFHGKYKAAFASYMQTVHFTDQHVNDENFQ